MEGFERAEKGQGVGWTKCTEQDTGSVWGVGIRFGTVVKRTVVSGIVCNGLMVFAVCLDNWTHYCGLKCFCL